jgi:hypothetical protein
MTAAGDPDILAGVERWARVRDLWMGDGGCEIVTWRVGGSLAGCRIFEYSQRNSRSVSPALALTWALLVETDAGPVDVGRCRTCRGRECMWTWAQSIRTGLHFIAVDEAAGWREHGWHAEVVQCGEYWRHIRAKAKRCPACSGTGRETIPVTRLLLDAASGDAAARAALSVHADHLQATGDPRGELLALALGPWPGEPTRFEWFYASTEETSALMVADGWTRGPAKVPGVRLTHAGRRVAAWPFSRPVLPGTAPALRWLEWLTWAREFAAGREAQAPTLRDEVESLARASVLSYTDTFDLVARARAAGATYTERLRLGVRGMVMLVNAYESGALATTRRPG